MTATISKLQAIVALALCPSAPQGEWEASAIAIFRICRTHKLNPFALSAPPRRDDSCSPIIGFGKHKGRTAKWIAQNVPDYGVWLLGNATKLSPFIREALQKELRATYGRC